MIKNNIQNWFKKWFSKFGITYEILKPSALEGFFYFKEINEPLSPEEALIHFTSLYEVPQIIKWNYKVFNEDSPYPYLGRQIWGQWWKKFNDSHLAKRKIKIYSTTEKPLPKPSTEVAKLISSLGKRKLEPDEKEQLRMLLNEEDSDEDLLDDDYNPCLDDFSQDPNLL